MSGRSSPAVSIRSPTMRARAVNRAGGACRPEGAGSASIIGFNTPPGLRAPADGMEPRDGLRVGRYGDNGAESNTIS